MLLAAASVGVRAEEQCEFYFTDCPENFDGDTIAVPENVVQLASRIKACPSSRTTTTGEELTAPSVMFIIDHSGSMTGEGRGDNDVMGSRFTVTKDLLDTIYNAFPEAEVGLAVFREHLYFDVSSDEYFARYFQGLDTTYDSEPNQAYLPLMQLNKSYDGKEGIDVIKDVLQTDTVKTGGFLFSSRHVDLTYKPDFDASLATNINIAFTAARAAMSASENPAERQFIIFLSDGEPMGESQAGLPMMDFVNGEDLPTTYTVFFTRDNDAPESLEDMTENIRQNGYSATNPQSNLWAIETNYERLMLLLMKNVIGTILVSGDPIGMTVNGGEMSTTYEGEAFEFAAPFPLNQETSSFTIDISYRQTGMGGAVLGDTIKSVKFHVEREQDASPPEGIELSCWSEPDPPDTTDSVDPDTGDVVDPDTSDTSDTSDPDTSDVVDPDTSDTSDTSDPDTSDVADPDTSDTSDVTEPDTSDSASPPPPPPPEVNVGVSDNPFVPERTAIPRSVRSYYANVLNGETRGVVVGLSSSAELAPLKGDEFGEADIYDAVGNLLVSDLAVKEAKDGGDYGVHWSGHNDNGRVVGPGAYLMVIYLKSEDGDRLEKRIKLGVQAK
jgi:hypothetical protein